MTISAQHHERRINELRQEHILIVGLTEKTGLSVASYLSKYSIPFSITDRQTKEKSISILKTLSNQAINIYSGPQTIDQLQHIKRIIISPGVPASIPLIQEAKRQKIHIMSDIELAYQLSGVHQLIGITGSHGKTTACTLLKHMLQKEIPTHLGGNIGVPYISLIDSIKPNEYMILELSSFMLEWVDAMQCDYACILNTHPNHLDRYSNFNDYVLAKKNIFKNQNPLNMAILNWNCKTRPLLTQGLQSQIHYFLDGDPNLNLPEEQAHLLSYIKDNTIYFKQEPIISRCHIPNKSLSDDILLSSISIAKQIGISTQSIQKAIQNFKGLANRLEYMGEYNGIHFVNDTKSTSIQSTIYALEKYPNPTHLLMGGQNKNISFNLLTQYLKPKVKSLILFGECAKDMANQIQFESTYITDNLEEAFKKSLSLSVENDLVLLSPGCASFDQYANYEERGQHFKQLIKGHALS